MNSTDEKRAMATNSAQSPPAARSTDTSKRLYSHGGVAGLPCAHKGSRLVGQGKLGKRDVGKGSSDGAQEDGPYVAAAHAQQAAGE
eukprot:6194113-Pleurochrysis_carterae.AAC.1